MGICGRNYNLSTVCPIIKMAKESRVKHLKRFEPGHSRPAASYIIPSVFRWENFFGPQQCSIPTQHTSDGVAVMFVFGLELGMARN